MDLIGLMYFITDVLYCFWFIQNKGNYLKNTFADLLGEKTKAIWNEKKTLTEKTKINIKDFNKVINYNCLIKASVKYAYFWLTNTETVKNKSNL